MTFLVRVTAPHFCAGLVVDTGDVPTVAARVTEAAPILRWTFRGTWADAICAFRKKGWAVEMWP